MPASRALRHTGIHATGTGGDTEVGFIGGMDFAGGRGHITTSASGIRRSELEIYRRDWAILPYGEYPKGGWSSTGRPATFIPGNSANVNTDGIIDPNCAALGGAPTSSNKRCRFQYTPFDNLVEKTRRWPVRPGIALRVTLLT